MKPMNLIRSLSAVSVIAACVFASSAVLAVKVGPVEDPIRVVKILKGQPIVIGVYQVLSGADTALGLDQWRAIEVAADDVGKQILGHPIKFITEDGQCNAEGGQTAATKIAANQQTVVTIGGSCSSETTPGAPILWKAGIPSIGTSPSAPTLTAPNRPEGYHGFVRTIYNDLWMGREVANWSLKVLKFKKFATIHDGSPYAEKLVRVFQKQIKEGGGEIVSDEAVSPTDTEMHAVLTKISAAKPEMIYLPTFVAATAHIIRQAKEVSGLEKVKLVGADAVLAKQFLESAGKAVIGFDIPTTAQEPEAQGKGYNEFVERYKKKFGEGPLQVFHGNAYDAFMMAKVAIEKVAVKDDQNTYVPIKALRDAIFATKNHDGITGKLTCDQYGDCAVFKFAVYRFNNADPNTLDLGKNPNRIYPEKFE